MGTEWNGFIIRHDSEIEHDMKSDAIDIAIIVTPASEAQALADRLVGAGVNAILNFAPIQLQTPSGVVVKNVNLALELEALSYGLKNH